MQSIINTFLYFALRHMEQNPLYFLYLCVIGKNETY